MKVFVITKGSYSDYRIETVFSTKEKAEEFLRKAADKEFDGIDSVLDGEYNEIEEYEIDVDYTQNGLSGYEATITRYQKGKTYTRVRLLAIENTSNIDFNIVSEVKSSNSITYIVNVWAEDQQHAAKIASELIAQYKAEQNHPKCLE